MQLLQLLLILNSIFLCHSFRQLLVPNSSSFSKKKDSCDITALYPLWNCPWLGGAVLQYPSFFAFFHAFTASSSIFSNNTDFLQDSQASFGTKLKKKCLTYPVPGTVPMELPCWNDPWSRGGVLQCSGFLAFLYAVAAGKCFFLHLLCIFAILFACFGVKKQVLYEEGRLNFLLI